MTYFIIIFYLGICFLVANKIGRFKKIGFWPTLLICIFLSPLIGYLVASVSKVKS